MLSGVPSALSDRIYIAAAGDAVMIAFVMYAVSLHNATDTRRFSIMDAGASGWQVMDQAGGRVLKQALYDDWHRVERARALFKARVAVLRGLGWVEDDGAGYSTNR